MDLEPQARGLRGKARFGCLASGFAKKAAQQNKFLSGFQALRLSRET
mgnify:CR=1 FL=1